MASTTDSIPMRNPRLHAAAERAWTWCELRWRLLASYFSERSPTFRVALLPMIALSCVLYMRWLPTTNYIFDEQEALLGNPYVNQKFKYEDAIYRDFWGLPANASIGSYRPVPNYMWRGLVEVGERGQRIIDAQASDSQKQWMSERFEDGKQPFDLSARMRTSWPQHWFNLLLHGVNGALFVAMGWRLTRRRMTAWFAGTAFVACALLTEAVSGVVGIADVLGGLGALLALASLGLRAHVMPFAVFLSIMLGLFSKESAIVCVPLVPVAALMTAPIIHAERPARLVRGALAGFGALAAFVVYVELRKRWFPSPLPSELNELPAPGSGLEWAARDFLVWFHQAPLPKDPLNNPLVDAPTDLRVAGAMRVYFRGLIQVVFPWHLSGDYSSPQEPIPDRVIFPESALGWGATVLPLGGALGVWIVTLIRELSQREPLTPEPGPTPADERAGAPSPAVAYLRSTSLGAFVARHRAVLVRGAVELAIVVVAVLLTRKLLGIGPGEVNKDIPDPDPEKKAIIPEHILQDILVYGGFSCVAFGALTESLWKPRTEGRRDVTPIIAAIGLVWLVVSYFPHSNMYVLLPTVRAERLWYFPVLGTTMVVALALTGAFDWARRTQLRGYAWMIPAGFLGFQAARAYWHATDYRDDLTFWKATKDAVPNSAKAHLNYSVMAGARGMMEVRLMHSHISRNLAPKWAMAHVYTGDTLCRMGRPDEAWPHYARGFEIGPNEKGLVSLALQCLFDTKKLKEHEAELRAMSAENPGSWLAHLAIDTLDNGDKQGGVQREAKGRGYNEGPKDGDEGE